MRTITALIVVTLIAATPAPTTRPTTRPSTEAVNPDLMLKQLLSPARPAVRPIDPVQYPAEGGQTARPPAAKRDYGNLIREGTILPDRIGRLTRTPEGQTELTFESDGQSLKDPPMLILPNLKLMDMETAIKTHSRDLKFLVTGTVTEYNGRNYILLDKAVVVQDSSAPPSRKGDDRR